LDHFRAEADVQTQWAAFKDQHVGAFNDVTGQETGNHRPGIEESMSSAR
jgi:hypothetical protein